MKIRLTQSNDIPSLVKVLDGTKLFPSEMLPAMVSPFLSDANSDDIWLTCESNGEALGFCYAAPEQLTSGTWNMLAIAVLPSKQGNHIGTAIVEHLEATLRERGQRILIAETSGKEEFKRARMFYQTNEYAEEARIRDFWAVGDDKVIFWKALI